MDYFDWYAAYLHRTCPVADGHLNLVTEVYRRRLKGETGILNQYYKKEFLRGGVNLVFASLFFGADELEACLENGIFPKGALLKKAMELLRCFYAMGVRGAAPVCREQPGEKFENHAIKSPVCVLTT